MYYFSSLWQMRHLFLLLSQFVNHMEVIKLPVYYPSEEEKADPRLYANNVRKLMATEVCTICLFLIIVYSPNQGKS